MLGRQRVATRGNWLGNFRAGNHHWDSSEKAEGKARGKAKRKRWEATGRCVPQITLRVAIHIPILKRNR